VNEGEATYEKVPEDEHIQQSLPEKDIPPRERHDSYEFPDLVGLYLHALI